MSVIFLLAKKQYNFIFINNPVHLLILKILILTDRELCGFCKATFDTTLTEGENRAIIKSVTPELNVISVNKELEGTDKGIFYLGELVPTLSSGYYLGL